MKVAVGQLRKVVNEEMKSLLEVRPRKRPDQKKEAGKRLMPLMKLTGFDKYGYIVPKNNTSKSPVLLSISTYSVHGGEGSAPPHLEVVSYGGGVDKHRETPGNQAYRAALGALWNLVYPEIPGNDRYDTGMLTVSDAVKMWPSIEELLITANDEKTELDKVRTLPRETPAQKKYMDHSWTNEDQFITKAAEYLLLRDMGQDPWDVDRDAYISEFGEDAYYDALKDYAIDAQDAIMTLVNNDEPATMRNLEKYLKKGKAPKGKKRR